jgi:hypothetical protein
MCFGLPCAQSLAGCPQDWVMTDGQHTITSDEDVRQLQQGCGLQALPPDMAFYTVRLLGDAYLLVCMPLQQTSCT